MRWKTVIVGLTCILSLAAGCKEQVFMTDQDFNRYKTMGLSPDAEIQPASIYPDKIDPIPVPPSVPDPDRAIRYLTLQEAIAIALESGNIGRGVGSGAISDELPAFAGDFTPIDRSNIRVLSLEPALFYTNIDQSMAKFDAQWISSLNYTTTDRPVATSLDQFQAGTQNVINTQDATANSTLIKPLPSGGYIGITANTAYEFTNLPARVNPSYTPSLTFGLEQPLLQYFGVGVNELTDQRPPSLLFPQLLNYPRNFSAIPGHGILLTRVRYDQSRMVLEYQVSQLLYNVEIAYWNLYAAYGGLHAREQPMRLAQEIWQEEYAKKLTGRQPGQSEAQARGQFQQFREQRLAALANVLESERQLRGLLGMKVSDGTRLVPADKPVLAPYQPDWNAAVEDCVKLRPELLIAREQIKACQMNVRRLKNLLLPDLRLTAGYTINGLGSELDGPDANNALRSLASNRFDNWTLGVTFNVPIGYRAEYAQVRQAQIRLAQSYFVLQDFELRATRLLQQQYGNLSQFEERRKALQAEREAYGEQFGLLNSLRRERATPSDQPQLLESLRFWSQSRVDECNMIAQYNEALAGFEFAKGTILQHDNVSLADGPLPCYAQGRAVEHERERTKGIVLRELAKPVVHPPCDTDKNTPGLPALPANEAPSVPALLQGAPAVGAGVEQTTFTQPLTPVGPADTTVSPIGMPATSPGMLSPSALFDPSMPAAYPGSNVAPAMRTRPVISP